MTLNPRAVGVLIAAMIVLVMSAVFLLRGPEAAAASAVASFERFDMQSAQAVLTQADRRAIFTFTARDKAYACPEPSPDVKADVNAAVRSLASLSAKLPEGLSADVKAELDTNRKLITAALIQRSQGLQVLRDMLFQACLANLRGDLPAAMYSSFVTVNLPKLTVTLIATELLTKQESGKIALSGKDLETFLGFLQLYQGS